MLCEIPTTTSGSTTRWKTPGPELSCSTACATGDRSGRSRMTDSRASNVPTSWLCRPSDWIARPGRDSSPPSRHNPRSSSSGKTGPRQGSATASRRSRAGYPRASTPGCRPVHAGTFCRLVRHAYHVLAAEFRLRIRLSYRDAWIVPTSPHRRPCLVRESAPTSAQPRGRHDRRSASVCCPPLGDQSSDCWVQVTWAMGGTVSRRRSAAVLGEGVA